MCPASGWRNLQRSERARVLVRHGWPSRSPKNEDFHRPKVRAELFWHLVPLGFLAVTPFFIFTHLGKVSKFRWRPLSQASKRSFFFGGVLHNGRVWKWGPPDVKPMDSGARHCQINPNVMSAFIFSPWSHWRPCPFDLLTCTTREQHVPDFGSNLLCQYSIINQENNI